MRNSCPPTPAPIRNDPNFKPLKAHICHHVNVMRLMCIDCPTYEIPKLSLRSHCFSLTRWLAIYDLKLFALCRQLLHDVRPWYGLSWCGQPWNETKEESSSSMELGVSRSRGAQCPLTSELKVSRSRGHCERCRCRSILVRTRRTVHSHIGAVSALRIEDRLQVHPGLAQPSKTSRLVDERSEVV